MLVVLGNERVRVVWRRTRPRAGHGAGPLLTRRICTRTLGCPTSRGGPGKYVVRALALAWDHGATDEQLAEVTGLSVHAVADYLRRHEQERESESDAGGWWRACGIHRPSRRSRASHRDGDRAATTLRSDSDCRRLAR